MKAVFHEDFYLVYTSDPAAAPKHIEADVSLSGRAVTIIRCRGRTLWRSLKG
ncbi:hypothetical protein ACFL9T_18935 [Thermodesulfobacteriota bacterium]